MAEAGVKKNRGSFLLTVAALTIVIAGLKFSATFLVPLLSALFLAVLSFPGVRFLQEKARLPAAVAVLTMLVLQLAVLSAIFAYVGKSLSKLTSLESAMIARIEEVKELDAYLWLEGLLAESTEEDESSENSAAHEVDAGGDDAATGEGDAASNNANGEDDAASDNGAGEDEAAAAGTSPTETSETTDPDSEGASSLDKFVDSASAFIRENTLGLLKPVANMMSQAFLVIMTMVFLLMEAGTVRGKLRNAFGADGTRERLGLAMQQVQSYLVIKTATSLATGICAALLLWAIGIQEPILWGFLAFLLNYIPTIGSVLAAIPPVLLAFLHGFGSMGLVALGYGAINILIGNVLEPLMMGRKMGLSPLIVFLSMVLWNLIWGPVGMILSVPLTMTVKIFLENSERGRAVAVLMGSDDGPPKESPAPST